MLEVDVQRRFGPLTIAARFESDEGVTALFGRSGAGKTSLVNMISGLIAPERGRIVVGGRVLFDSDRAIDVPARKRRIGYVFQDGRLFPHLTVRQNLHYGRWFTPRPARYVEAGQVMELLGLDDLLDRRPGSLSGGEMQRVAIGRALLASPSILLMDEPLASLDAARKAEILPYIERLRDRTGLPIVYVSHSIEEISRLAETVVLMSAGAVVAVGQLADVMSRLDLHPFTGRYEAGAVLEARVEAHDDAFELSHLVFSGGTLKVPLLDLPVGARARVRIRSRDVIIALQPPRGLSIRNVFKGRIVETSGEEGPFAELKLDVGGSALIARITKHAVDDLGLEPGREIYALIKSVALDRRSLGHAGTPGAQTGADGSLDL